jgi:predicted site-specific integrase-resolvase
MEKHLKINEAADFLAVSALTLRRWDESGKLKPIKIDQINK